MANSTAQLVCEGECNGENGILVDRFDEAVRVNRRIGRGLDGEERVKLREDLVFMGRELRHTPHVYKGVGTGMKIIYACKECGNQRVYGANR